jgi:hypothetical protein
LYSFYNQTPEYINELEATIFKLQAELKLENDRHERYVARITERHQEAMKQNEIATADRILNVNSTATEVCFEIVCL